eukprot:1541480-Alexandrium_andersonii.AAC.1
MRSRCGAFEWVLAQVTGGLAEHSNGTLSLLWPRQDLSERGFFLEGRAENSQHRFGCGWAEVYFD